MVHILWPCALWEGVELVTVSILWLCGFGDGVHFVTVCDGVHFMMVFSVQEHHSSGEVMYVSEVVTGIPKSEGMKLSAKDPSNPSIVELEEDENTVEKFKKSIANFASVLVVDWLRQEVTLKKKLVKSGKVVKKRLGATVRPLGMIVV